MNEILTNLQNLVSAASQDPVLTESISDIGQNTVNDAIESAIEQQINEIYADYRYTINLIILVLIMFLIVFCLSASTTGYVNYSFLTGKFNCDDESNIDVNKTNIDDESNDDIDNEKTKLEDLPDIDTSYDYGTTWVSASDSGIEHFI